MKQPLLKLNPIEILHPLPRAEAKRRFAELVKVVQAIPEQKKP